VLFAALGLMLLRDATRRSMPKLETLSTAIIGLGCIIMAIAGLLPPRPGQTSYAPLLMAGVWVSLAGFGLHLAGLIASLAQKVLRFRRRSRDVR